LFCLFGAPTLTRGRVCNSSVQLLLGLASAVTLRSRSRGTRDHVLTVSFETGFPLFHLLRLAGLRCRHSIPPAHPIVYDCYVIANYWMWKPLGADRQETSFTVYTYYTVSNVTCYLAMIFVLLLHYLSLPSVLLLD
jgi:hypothetical protein